MTSKAKDPMKGEWQGNPHCQKIKGPNWGTWPLRRKTHSNKKKPWKGVILFWSRFMGRSDPSEHSIQWLTCHLVWINYNVILYRLSDLTLVNCRRSYGLEMAELENLTILITLGTACARGHLPWSQMKEMRNREVTMGWKGGTLPSRTVLGMCE